MLIKLDLAKKQKEDKEKQAKKDAKERERKRQEEREKLEKQQQELNRLTQRSRDSEHSKHGSKSHSKNKNTVTSNTKDNKVVKNNTPKPVGTHFSTAPGNKKPSQSIPSQNLREQTFKSNHDNPNHNSNVKVSGNLMDDLEEEYSEEEIESEYHENQFKHSTDRDIIQTPNFEQLSKGGRKIEEPKKIINKPSANIVKTTETFNTIENNNELEIVGQDQYPSSEFLENEEDEDDDDEEEVKVLLDILRRFKNEEKLKLATTLIKFIKSNHRAEKLTIPTVFESESILNFNENTCKLLDKLIEKNSKKKDDRVMNCENCASLLMAILMSDKKNNFDSIEFTDDIENEEENTKQLKIDYLLQYMKNSTAKRVFEMIYQEIAHSNINLVDLNTKHRIGQNLAACIVTEDAEDDFIQKIVEILDNETKSTLKHASKPSPSQKLEIDVDDIEDSAEEKKSKRNHPKTANNQPKADDNQSKTKSYKDLNLNDMKTKEGLKIIQTADDNQRISTGKYLIEYIEKISLSNLKIDDLYDLKNSNVEGEEVLELMYDTVKRKAVPKNTRVEAAVGLLMQLLKSRERHNVDAEYLEENEEELDSTQIRRIIQEDSCQILYDNIFNHMIKVIGNGKSSIDL